MTVLLCGCAEYKHHFSEIRRWKRVLPHKFYSIKWRSQVYIHRKIFLINIKSMWIFFRCKSFFLEHATYYIKKIDSVFYPVNILCIYKKNDET